MLHELHGWYICLVLFKIKPPHSLLIYPNVNDALGNFVSNFSFYTKLRLNLSHLFQNPTFSSQIRDIKPTLHLAVHVFSSRAWFL